MKHLKRMHVFITGGTSGIGLELAELYLKEGHHVGVCGRDLSKIPDRFKDLYPMLHSFSIDVLEREKLLEVLRDFSKDGLDLMIVNAGISNSKVADVPNMDFERKILEINVFGALNSVEAALAVMLPHRTGHIVLVSSVAGMIGLPGAGAYSASKAALLKLGEAYAMDLRNVGIKVTTIAPGFIETPMTAANQHAMPFLMSAKDAALCISKAIRKGKVFYVFPWPMFVVTKILECLPRFIYRFLITSLGIKK